MSGPADDRSLPRRRLLLGGAAALAAVPLSGLAFPARASAAPPADHPVPRPPHPAAHPAVAPVEPSSRFFATVDIPYSSELNTASDGDLWPACWADDDNLYTANGDGKGFSTDAFADIVLNRVSGTPETGLTGVRLAAGDALGPVWSDPAQFNRKPTGIVAVDGNGDGRDELYLAVQDLRYAPGADAFNEAPAASIVCSTDYGVTWRATDAAMFTDHVFTTIMFLDFGRSNANAAVLGAANAGYVYAYGLDHNWRDSLTGIVPDPVDVYLARAPIASIQDRATWEFFAGTDDGGDPLWDKDIAARKAVLHDERRVYPASRNMSVISQGHVVYNAPLKRYLYASWSDLTFEFYEAPQPWGPWKLFSQKVFGPLPWWNPSSDPAVPGPKNGGYGTVIPSKYLSADGRSMWLQSNWWLTDTSVPFNYNFALRRMTLTPFAESTPDNPADPDTNLAMLPGAVPVDYTSHYGHVSYVNDGRTDRGEDSWDGEPKTVDFWGVTWPRAYRVNRVVYTSGDVFADGGWFAGELRVQVRKNLEWTDVTGMTVNPPYPNDNSAPHTAFTFTFDAADADGVRVIGTPGGSVTFTSITELAAYRDS